MNTCQGKTGELWKTGETNEARFAAESNRIKFIGAEFMRRIMKGCAGRNNRRGEREGGGQGEREGGEGCWAGRESK